MLYGLKYSKIRSVTNCRASNELEQNQIIWLRNSTFQQARLWRCFKRGSFTSYCNSTTSVTGTKTATNHTQTAVHTIHCHSTGHAGNPGLNRASSTIRHASCHSATTIEGTREVWFPSEFKFLQCIHFAIAIVFVDAVKITHYLDIYRLFH